MIDHSAKRAAMTTNYEAFEALLPLLLAERRGEFTVMRDRAIAGFFPSAGEAQAFGTKAYPDGLFSIQRVEEKAVDLGFYSHARYQRIA